MPNLRKLGLGLALGIGLSACASTPDPIYYLFPTPKLSTSLPYSGGTLAVREISLPLYARAQQIATAAEDGSVILSDDHRWADEPPRAATGALVSALKQLLNAPIVAEPWPTSAMPETRIDVTVDRFIGDTRGGNLEFSGQYRIAATDTSGQAQQESFSYSIPIAAPGYKALAEAHSAAIEKLAQEIASRITSSPAS